MILTSQIEAELRFVVRNNGSLFLGMLVFAVLLLALCGLGVAVGWYVRSAWSFLFPAILSILWIAGHSMFAEPDPDVTARQTVLGSLAMVFLPVAVGTAFGLLLARKSER